MLVFYLGFRLSWLLSIGCFAWFDCFLLFDRFVAFVDCMLLWFACFGWFDLINCGCFYCCACFV